MVSDVITVKPGSSMQTDRPAMAHLIPGRVSQPPSQASGLSEESGSAKAGHSVERWTCKEQEHLKYQTPSAHRSAGRLASCITNVGLAACCTACTVQQTAPIGVQHEIMCQCRSVPPPCNAAAQSSCMPVSGLQLKTGEISHCWAEEARRWRTSSGLGGPGLPATAADNGGLLCAEVPCMELLEIKSHQVGRLTFLHPLFRIWSVCTFTEVPFLLSHK